MALKAVKLPRSDYTGVFKMLKVGVRRRCRDGLSVCTVNSCDGPGLRRRGLATSS
jgi:hypothetical protein